MPPLSNQKSFEFLDFNVNNHLKTFSLLFSTLPPPKDEEEDDETDSPLTPQRPMALLEWL